MAFLPPCSYPNSAYLREDSIKWALQKATAVRGGGNSGVPDVMVVILGRTEGLS